MKYKIGDEEFIVDGLVISCGNKIIVDLFELFTLEDYEIKMFYSIGNRNKKNIIVRGFAFEDKNSGCFITESFNPCVNFEEFYKDFKSKIKEL